MKVKYGKTIVFVVAANFDEFVAHFRRRKDLLPTPIGTQGVIYSKTHNYRFVHDVRTMYGHRGVEVEFISGAERRADYEELVQQSQMVKRK